MNNPHYHEDIHRLHVGMMPRRSYYVPASTREIAEYPREVSDRAVFLSGGRDPGKGSRKGMLQSSVPAGRILGLRKCE